MDERGGLRVRAQDVLMGLGLPPSPRPQPNAPKPDPAVT